jgi:hypothetical protein
MTTRSGGRLCLPAGAARLTSDTSGGDPVGAVGALDVRRAAGGEPQRSPALVRATAPTRSPAANPQRSQRRPPATATADRRATRSPADPTADPSPAPRPPEPPAMAHPSAAGRTVPCPPRPGWHRCARSGRSIPAPPERRAPRNPRPRRRSPSAPRRSRQCPAPGPPPGRCPWAATRPPNSTQPAVRGASPPPPTLRPEAAPPVARPLAEPWPHRRTMPRRPRRRTGHRRSAHPDHDGPEPPVPRCRRPHVSACAPWRHVVRGCSSPPVVAKGRATIADPRHSLVICLYVRVSMKTSDAKLARVVSIFWPSMTHSSPLARLDRLDRHR